MKKIYLVHCWDGTCSDGWYPWIEEKLKDNDMDLSEEMLENKIIIIDNYVDDSILEMLTKKAKNVEVTIITSNKSNIEKLDIQKFNKQYPTLKLAYTNAFHDRFIIIDEKELYHLGASIKDLGKKCFAINKIEDISIIDKLVNE